ncbi:hypothetical protein GF391_03420 [Candidatus Uhrbacteria bacterium]|nr:hypothetical protein [Candidatus Uhrbacteria bacterium]
MSENPFVANNQTEQPFQEPFNPVIDLKVEAKSLHLPEIHLSAIRAEKAREKTKKVEEITKSISMDKILQKYHVPEKIYKNIKFYKIIDYLDEGAVLYEIPVLNHFSDKKLPEGYGYKGSAARALLLRSLNIDPSYKPRDIDVVRLSESEPYKGADDKIAQEFMPDDYEHGYGTEPISNFDDYFSNRDLTINEVLASDKAIFATQICILDNIRHILRITDFEKFNYSSTGRVGPKMLSKILRFYAEAIKRYDDASIENVEDWQFNEEGISFFWIALQLDRAYEIDAQVADNFVQQLVKHEQLPDEIQNADQALEYIMDAMEDDYFYFRHAPNWQFEHELEWIEYYDKMGYDEDYTQLPKHSGFGRSKSSN